MTVILSKWQKQHLLKEVYMCTDSWYTTVFLSPQLTLNWSLSNASSHITPDNIYPYLSFGACTLLILMALSGAVISIMWKTEGSFCLPVCAVSEAVPSIFHCRGACFFIIGDSVSHNVYIQYKATHRTRLHLCNPIWRSMLTSSAFLSRQAG